MLLCKIIFYIILIIFGFWNIKILSYVILKLINKLYKNYKSLKITTIEYYLVSVEYSI